MTPPQHWNGTTEVIVGVYGAIDCQQVVLLGLLDLSAAFDCVDHEILLRRLRSRFLTNTAYDWISSFLYGRSQQVFYKERLSAKLQLLFGVPRGDVLGPILFLLYTAELIDIIVECGLMVHAYTPTTLRFMSPRKQVIRLRQWSAWPTAL